MAEKSSRACIRCGVRTKKAARKYCSSVCYRAVRTSPASDRFWSKVNKAGSCWEWTGAFLKTGYGAFRGAGGRTVSAHRESFRLANGRESKQCVLHVCDNRKCVNPSHLFEGDHADNALDKAMKRRAGKKLVYEQVIEIRRLCAAGVDRKDVAGRFGVTPENVGYILNGTIWPATRPFRHGGKVI